MEIINTILQYLIDFVWFFISAVIVKGIIVHWLADRIMDRVKPLFEKTERREAILSHFVHRHKDGIAQCDTGNCQTVLTTG